MTFRPSFALAALFSAATAFPAPAPRWAQAVDWARHGDTLRITVTKPWKGARAPLRYALPLRENGSGPSLPARRIVCLIAVHTGFLDALGAADRIVAVDAKSHVYHPGVRAGVDAGRIAEVGSGSGVDAERLLALKPDLVLANAIGSSEHAAYERLRRAGIPVLITAEWMEDHPLARAEWVRLFGILVGREKAADSLFGAIESSYLRVVRERRGAASRPSVLLGGPFRDQWFVSGGRSFMARLLGDAGGSYLWRNDSTSGGVPLAFEAVLARARNADVWLQPGEWRSLSAMRRQDPRFTAFTSFGQGAVYNNDARRRPDGANDYWESGTVRPDRVLADLAAIFQGTTDTLYYYRKLPQDH